MLKEQNFLILLSFTQILKIINTEVQQQLLKKKKKSENMVNLFQKWKWIFCQLLLKLMEESVKQLANL